MNWGKVLIAGVVGGIALNIVDFLLHGLVMSSVYTEYNQLFSQQQANPLWFLLIAVLIAFFAAALFSKTRQCWDAGAKGGVIFGVFLGLFIFFPPFYDALVYEGFPYHLSWCWGGINFIGMVVLGAVLGLIVNKT